MRDLSSLPELHTATELLAFLREAPADRFVVYGDYISIFSLNGIGVATIKEAVETMHRREYPTGPHAGEIATIGAKPACISKLLNDAEGYAAERVLRMTGYEDYFALTEHPEAER